LISNTEIIILDELTTGLDPKARREMWGHIKQLKAEGKTIFITTHYMEEATQLCDMIGIIDSGIDSDHPDFEGKIVPGYDFYNSDNWLAFIVEYIPLKS